MGIQAQIDRIKNNVTRSLAKVAEKGVTVPADANSDDLEGLIDAITGGGGGSSEMEEQWIRAIEGDPDKPVTKLPDGLTAIRAHAFYEASVAIKSIPAGVTDINQMAFYWCDGLTEITFKGTPSYIDHEAFSACSNLLTINVPWSEGKVYNAPWGATNATINYNYTGG